MTAPNLPQFFGYVTAAARQCLSFCLVVVVLVAVYEVFKEVSLFRRIGRRMEPLAARFHVSPRSIFPLSAGLFLGLIYGAGIIINAARERELDRRDILVLSLFLAVCHAVIEDTLLFVVIGGSTWWILGPRVVIALAVVWLAGMIVRPAKAA